MLTKQDFAVYFNGVCPEWVAKAIWQFDGQPFKLLALFGHIKLCATSPSFSKYFNPNGQTMRECLTLEDLPLLAATMRPIREIADAIEPLNN